MSVGATTCLLQNFVAKWHDLFMVFQFQSKCTALNQKLRNVDISTFCAPDGVPVTLLKTCSRELCQPIKLIWAESFAKKEIPSFYKQTCISPIYKNGNRAEATNYRPIALTSHIIKIYEIYLREVMVKFIEHNELLCNSQHGFVSCKSCLTQLLSHVDDIYEGLLVVLTLMQSI